MNKFNCKMAGLLKYFQQHSLPRSSNAGLEEALTKEANAAVKQVAEEELNRATGCKCKYVHFTPKQRTKIAKYTVQCGYTADTRHFSKEFSLLHLRLFK